MRGFAQHGRRATKRALGVNQFRGTVRVPVVAVVAGLIGQSAIGTGSANKPIRQKRLGFGVKQLLDRSLGHQIGIAKRLPELAAQFAVGIAVGAAVMIELNSESRKITLVRLAHVSDQRFLAASFLASADHDRRPVCVVSAHVEAAISNQLLEANPDIGLQVFHQVPDVNGAVGVRQCAGD